MHNAVLVFRRILVPLLFFCSCFGPFDPYDPPPDQGDDGTSTSSPFASGLVAWWTCNDSATNYLADTLGENDGQITGCTRDSGISGLALRFNGNGDFVSVNDSVASFGTGDFTVSLWVKPLVVTLITDTTKFNIISNGVATEQGFTLSITRRGCFTAFVGQSTALSLDTSSTATDDEWHHLALVRRSGTVTLYVDNSVTQSFDTQSNMTTDLRLLIGRDASGRTDRYYSGLVDEIKLFGSAWGSTDVNTEYQRFGS